ncbi:hypothetical protein ID866_13145, partial [Astraeus odoratus]
MHPRPMYHHLPWSAAHAHACTCPAYHHPPVICRPCPCVY